MQASAPVYRALQCAILWLLTVCATGCEREDNSCWSIKSRQYTNEVRQRHGVNRPLKDGLQSQLNNAHQYAAHLSKIGSLKHQLLTTATQSVGCGRWIGGENIAYHFEPNADIALKCVQQWENSPPHLANILREWFEEVAVGFYFSPVGSVYCVQTFASVSDQNDAGSLENNRGCVPFVHGPHLGGRNDVGSKGTPTQISATTIQQTRAPYEQLYSSPAESQSARAEQSRNPSVQLETVPWPSISPPEETDSSEPEDEEFFDVDGEDESDLEDEGVLSDDDWDETRILKIRAKRSCRCLQVSEKCWYSLGQLSDYKCIPFTPAFHQPIECRQQCCNFCEKYRDSALCKNPLVTFVCLFDP